MERDRLDNPAGNGIGILRELRLGLGQVFDVIHDDRAGIVGKRPRFDQFARIEKRSSDIHGALAGSPAAALRRL